MDDCLIIIFSGDEAPIKQDLPDCRFHKLYHPSYYTISECISYEQTARKGKKKTWKHQQIMKIVTKKHCPHIRNNRDTWAENTEQQRKLCSLGWKMSYTVFPFKQKKDCLKLTIKLTLK